MNTTENQVGDATRNENAAAAKSQRVHTVAWLTGVTAVVALANMGDGATVGEGLGVIGVSGMVSVVSYLILRS